MNDTEAMDRPNDEMSPRVTQWEWPLFFLAGFAAIAVLVYQPDALWLAAMQSWTAFSAWAQVNLLAVSESSPLVIALLPCAAMIVFAAVLQLLWNRPPNAARVFVAAIFLVLQAGYLVFNVQVLCVYHLMKAWLVME